MEDLVKADGDIVINMLRNEAEANIIKLVKKPVVEDLDYPESPNIKKYGKYKKISSIKW